MEVSRIAVLLLVSVLVSLIVSCTVTETVTPKGAELAQQQDPIEEIQGGQRFLADVVKDIEEVVQKEGESGRLHVMHFLFAMRAAGWDVDYAQVISLTGLPFVFTYQADNRHAAYAIPDGWESRTANATGFSWEWVHQETTEDAWRIVKESVDSGRVVWAEWMEGVTFAGYKDADATADRKVFAIAPVFALPGRWWSWSEFEEWWRDWASPALPFRTDFGRHAGDIVPVSSREGALVVLRNIPGWAESNLPGLAAYADDIEDTAKGVEHIDEAWRGCHAIMAVSSPHKYAAPYIRQIADLFSSPVREHLLAAADAYQAAYSGWTDFYGHLGENAAGEGEAAEQAVEKAWRSSENRLAGSRVVRQILGHEKTALDEVELALAAVE